MKFSGELVGKPPYHIEHNLGTKEVYIAIYSPDDRGQVVVLGVVNTSDPNVAKINPGFDLDGYRVVVIDADWMVAIAAVAYGAGRDADPCDSVPQWVEQSYLASRRKDNA